MQGFGSRVLSSAEQCRGAAASCACAAAVLPSAPTAAAPRCCVQSTRGLSPPFNWEMLNDCFSLVRNGRIQRNFVLAEKETGAPNTPQSELQLCVLGAACSATFCSEPLSWLSVPPSQ